MRTMTASKATDIFDYERLVEMISAFQWLPEQQCIRLARDREAGEPIQECINSFAAEMGRLSLQRRLSANYIHLFLVLLSQQYEAVQKIDGDSVVSEVNRIVEMIGVNLELIGTGNAYTTAFGLLLRSRVPLQWNRFCDFIEKREWRAPLTQHSGTVSTEAVTGNIHAGGVNGEPSANTEAIKVPVHSQTMVNHNEPQIVTGMAAQAFANEAFAAAADKILYGTELEGQSEEPPLVVFNQPESDTSKKTSSKWKFGFR